jgi:thioredoxin-like negative regulator of GroEL
MLASQFGLRAIPTVYLLGQGLLRFQLLFAGQDFIQQGADRFFRLRAFKTVHLKAQQALALMQEEKYADALPLLKEAWQLSNQDSQIVQLLFAGQDFIQQGADRFFRLRAFKTVHWLAVLEQTALRTADPGS